MKTLLVLLSALTVATPAAAEPKDAAKEQLRRLQQAQRKLEQEKSQLAQQKTALETQLKDAEAKGEQADRKAAAAGRRSAVLAREADAVHAERDKLAAELAEAKGQNEQHRKEIASRQASEQKLSAQLKQRGQELGQCEAKNLALYRHGAEMGKRLADWSGVDTLLAAEPFTGLKRVEIENVLEEYQDKLEAQRLEAAPQTGR